MYWGLAPVVLIHWLSVGCLVLTLAGGSFNCSISHGFLLPDVPLLFRGKLLIMQQAVMYASYHCIYNGNMQTSLWSNLHLLYNLFQSLSQPLFVKPLLLQPFDHFSEPSLYFTNHLVEICIKDGWVWVCLHDGLGILLLIFLAHSLELLRLVEEFGKGYFTTLWHCLIIWSWSLISFQKSYCRMWRFQKHHCPQLLRGKRTHLWFQN